MRQKGIITITVFMILILTVFNIRLLEKNKILRNNILKSEQLTVRYQNENKSFRNNLELFFQEISLSPDTKLFRPNDKIDTAINIKEPVLFLFFSELACEQCNQNVLDSFIIKSKTIHPYIKLGLLVPKEKIKSFYQSVKYQRSDIEVFGFSSNLTELQDLNRIKQPVICILNKSHRFQNYMIIERNKADRIDYYFRRILLKKDIDQTLM